MNGTWSSVVAVPANDVLGNSETLYLPELDTFSTSGTVVTSSAAAVLELEIDGLGTILGATQIGQGNWRFRGGKFNSTQWRFLSNAATGQPVGYVKVIVEWHLVNRNTAEGVYQVEMLQLDMSTPFTSGGSPIVIPGFFEMWRLPVESLP